MADDSAVATPIVATMNVICAYRLVIDVLCCPPPSHWLLTTKSTTHSDRCCWSPNRAYYGMFVSNRLQQLVSHKVCHVTFRFCSSSASYRPRSRTQLDRRCCHYFYAAMLAVWLHHCRCPIGIVSLSSWLSIDFRRWPLHPAAVEIVLRVRRQ